MKPLEKMLAYTRKAKTLASTLALAGAIYFAPANTHNAKSEVVYDVEIKNSNNIEQRVFEKGYNRCDIYVHVDNSTENEATTRFEWQINTFKIRSGGAWPHNPYFFNPWTGESVDLLYPLQVGEVKINEVKLTNNVREVQGPGVFQTNGILAIYSIDFSPTNLGQLTIEIKGKAFSNGNSQPTIGTKRNIAIVQNTQDTFFKQPLLIINYNNNKPEVHLTGFHKQLCIQSLQNLGACQQWTTEITNTNSLSPNVFLPLNYKPQTTNNSGFYRAKTID